MIAPFIIEDLERDRRRSEWQPQPLYIEAPRPYASYRHEQEKEPEPPQERVIIIDYRGEVI